MSASDQPALVLVCPYCDTPHHTPSDPRHSGELPRQIETMPYTRSKGEFEGNAAWSRIGLDFMAELVNWEAVGILRVPEGDSELDISYQLHHCDSCGYYFDTYLNWTPDRDFETIWPHLFARDDTPEIERVQRMSWTFGMLDRLPGPYWFSAVLVAVVLFGLSFVPRLLIAIGQNPAHILQEFWAISSIAVITRVAGGLTLAFLLNHSRKYVRMMQTTDEFHPLFAVQRHEHTTHWLNYTVSRVTGVQVKPDGYAITQASLLAGYPSAMILLGIWLFSRLRDLQSGLSPAANLGLLLLLMLAGYLYGSWRTFSRGEARRVLSPKILSKNAAFFEQNSWLARVGKALVRGLDWFLPVTGDRLRGVAMGQVIWVGLAVTQMILADPADWEWVIDGLFEALFWMVVAYYIGTHIQMAFTMSIYVLFQVGRIPLKVHPLLGFSELAPVKKLVSISMMTLMAVLLFVLVLTALEVLPWSAVGITLPAHQVIQNTTWLFDWVTVGILLMFFVLGFIISRWIPLGVIVYLFLLVILNRWVSTLPVCPGTITEVCRETRAGLDVSVIKVPLGSSFVSFWPSLILMSVFLYMVSFVYIEVTQQLYIALQDRAKRPYLAHFNQRIKDLSAALLNGAPASDEAQLVELIQIRDYVQAVQADRSLARWAIDAAIPLAFSLGPPFIQIIGQVLGIPS